jgi:hypothetical protein
MPSSNTYFALLKYGLVFAIIIKLAEFLGYVPDEVPERVTQPHLPTEWDGNAVKVLNAASSLSAVITILYGMKALLVDVRPWSVPVPSRMYVSFRRIAAKGVSQRSPILTPVTIPRS